MYCKLKLIVRVFNFNKRGTIRLFGTKNLESKEFSLVFSLQKSPKAVNKLPFVYPLERLHHNFSDHFRKQPLSQGYLKDPFSEHRVEVIKSSLPFHVFEIFGRNLSVENSEENKTFGLKDFNTGPLDKKMQIFAGDYSKFTKSELVTSKMENFGIDFGKIYEKTTPEKQSLKIFLNGEEAMKVAVSIFLKELKKYSKKSLRIKSLKGFKIKGDVNVSFSTVYQPLYLLQFGIFGITYRVTVNGVTGVTSGPIILSPLRLALLGLSFVAVYFFSNSPQNSEVSSIIGQTIGSIPVVATFVLIFCYFYARRQVYSNITIRENNFSRFYEKMREAKKRNFYQNWFLYQNAKERHFHRWLRDSSFEDYRRRFERAYPNAEKDYFDARSTGYGDSFRERKADGKRKPTERRLYEILGLSRGATIKEIDTAFKALVKKWHPDRFTNKNEEEKRKAESRFNDIMNAHQVLKDENRRKNYDLTGRTDK